MYIRVYSVLILTAYCYAFAPSCATTQNTATTTQIEVTETPCNAWVWVRARGYRDGQPIIGAYVMTQTEIAFTNHAGYACLWLTGPTLTRIHAGTNFQGWEGMLWPAADPVEIRLSWVSRAD